MMRFWSSGAMPMPVSRTEKRSVPRRPARGGSGTPGRWPASGGTSGSNDAVSSTPPFFVNFTALLARLTRTCRMRSSSTISRGMGADEASIEMSLPEAWMRNVAATRESISGKSHGAGTNFILSASSLERSSTSFTSARSVRALKRTFSAASVRSLSSSTPCTISSEKPMMELSGVRMSWLTIEKNMLLAFSAASVASRRAGGRA